MAGMIQNKTGMVVKNSMTTVANVQGWDHTEYNTRKSEECGTKHEGGR